ncbi:phosphatidylinositol kinase [Achlya hypogyna]|uniref:phosphatidylinositol 3-kinase n=1 Tax=Achlya hypogyna TaxID=1202772 RepID=A0A1V9YN83_ACHHY|nr:phosphatidylinositol kinase [Achlya hypogyna]
MVLDLESSGQSMATSARTPSFAQLNPYAHFGRRDVPRWQPVPGLVHSKETLAFRQSVGEILTKVHGHVSPETLEIRANTPEYRLEKDDWLAHANTKITPTLKTVARLPMSLLILDPNTSVMPDTMGVTTAGYLHKRGETNTAFQRRYFVLENRVLTYHKRDMFGRERPKGHIKLDNVSSVRPGATTQTNKMIELVTTERTWYLQAETDAEYDEWVKALCTSVNFLSVDGYYRRMLQLAEVSVSGPNEVRMVTLANYTVQETVEHIFECYNNMLDAAPLHQHDPNEFVLKVTGYRDYMIDRQQEVGNYQHVRECLLTRKTLCLTLVHQSKIKEALLRRVDLRPMDLLPPPDVRARNGSRSNCTTLGGDWTSNNAEPVVGKSCHYREPLRFYVNRVLNVPTFTTHLRRTAHEMGVEQRPLLYTNCVVVMELVNAGSRLELIGETTDIRLKSLPPRGSPPTKALIGLWLEPKQYRTKMKLCEIPRTARLVFTLYGVNTRGSNNTNGPLERERIMSTGLNVFDVDGYIAQGEQYLQLLENLYQCHRGPVPHVVYPDQPLLHLTLAQFHTDIAFDWSTVHAGGDPHVERLPSTDRGENLEKSGWLRKTGKMHAFTAWQRRWCVLNQDSCSLSYGELQHGPPKQTIPLANATIWIADELNEKVTQALTVSTRREEETCVFKVKPADSGREYIFSANSRQERQAWVSAIRLLANADVSDDELSRSSDASNLARRSITQRVTMCQEGLERALDELRTLIDHDPLYRLNSFQKSIMWSSRRDFMDKFAYLPRVLSCVNWASADDIKEMVGLLPEWTDPANPAGYIELLDMEFAHEDVRAFAVAKLAKMADTTFSIFLPQLVQALKFENHHASALAKHLIERAIKNPNQIGFDLFWAMKVESYNEQYKERYGLLLNTYVDVCSSKMRSILELQDRLFSEKGVFESICQEIKALHHAGKTKDEMKGLLHTRLEELNQTLPATYQLPIDPRVEVRRIVVKKAKIMSSAKLPLWLEFENAEEGGDPVIIIFKAGDDVRQDCLTLQLIRLMDEMWRDEGKDLAMEPYKCVSTGPMTGILQVVQHAITTAAIHKRAGGVTGAFNDATFYDWIQANNGGPDSRSYKAAVELFQRSCAGYCVATYVLGVGDRHNDNIMMTQKGRYFHIDFGHFLGFSKYQFGIKRETTPFVFTPEMGYVLSGPGKPDGKPVGKPDFVTFQNLCGEALNIVRRHLHLLVALLLLMIPAEMPELRTREDINHIVTVLAADKSDEEIAVMFDDLIVQCMRSTFKRRSLSMSLSCRVPSFTELNPYAQYGSALGRGAEGRWQPVPGLVHSNESLALRQAVGSILKDVHAHISTETLEIRANTPEYRLESDDWIAHLNANNVQPTTVKTVARLPMSLLQLDPAAAAAETEAVQFGGWLKKRGENNKAMKRRYMEIENKVLKYYKKKPEKSGRPLSGVEKEALMKGKIELDAVSVIQPTVVKGATVPLGIDLVTTNRTWALQAESDVEYDEWVKALCNSVPFHCVSIIYRRMLQLAEVSATGPNEVRMITLPTYTVHETVEHIFDCYNNMLDAAPLHPYDPKEYVLKLTGYRDYMIDRKQEVSSYQHVRECLITKKTLCLTLVHESKIQEALRQSMLGASGNIYDEPPYVAGGSARTLEVAMTTLGNDWRDPAYELGRAPAAGKSCAYTEPLRICINRVLNIPRYTTHLRRTAHEMAVERRPLLYPNVVVTIELFDGGRLLESLGETTDITLKAQSNDALIAAWHEPKWYRSLLRICDLPKSARVVLTVLGTRVPGADPAACDRILTTGINLFDVEGHLVQGEQYVTMLDNLYSCNQGPVPHVVDPEKPLAHLVFTSYSAPVKFDWSDHSTELGLARHEAVLKTGWLKKTGKHHQLTKWQPRWFTLSQASNTLSYAESPTAPAKFTIQLRGAQVLMADELNERYTTFAVSKGTRKEQSTWVFKLRVADSTREFVMCANTRQEREEWALAIKLVANGDTAEALDDLRHIIQRDPLFLLNDFQKAVLWRNRLQFMSSFEALRHVLACVNWLDPAEVHEMLTLLPQWAQASHPASYLLLLDMEFAHETVRQFAVDKLAEMADTTFSYFLPQLVQALKYESHHVSPLAKHLIERAIKNPNQIGFDLFWAMKVESYNEKVRERYGVLLNTYLDVCSNKMRAILQLQDKLFSEKGAFEQICQEIKMLHHAGKTKDELKGLLHTRLEELNQTLPATYQLPLDSRVEVGKIVVKKAKIMSSAKLPLWLEFENAEEGGDPVIIIFKAGDDVRQDCLTLQLIRLMDEMWREDGKDLAMEPYKCVSTGPMTGMLQVVLHSVTTAAVHKRGGAMGGIFGAFNDVSFMDWIQANNGDARSHRLAVDLFLRSCAGYCVATYVLGIGDRHNDNIMITKQGRYFHIDFGHFLGFMKYQYGIKREKTPFVFTPEMAHVFGGVGTPDFVRFQKTCGEAFNVVRKHLHLLVALFILMIPAEMPELRHRDDVNYLVDVSTPEKTDEEAAASFDDLVIQCMNNTFKRIDNTLHILKHR